MCNHAHGMAEVELAHVCIPVTVNNHIHPQRTFVTAKDIVAHFEGNLLTVVECILDDDNRTHSLPRPLQRRGEPLRLLCLPAAPAER